MSNKLKRRIRFLEDFLVGVDRVLGLFVIIYWYGAIAAPEIFINDSVPWSEITVVTSVYLGGAPLAQEVLDRCSIRWAEKEKREKEPEKK